MTKHDFLSYAKKQIGFINECPLSAAEIREYLHNNFEIQNIDFIIGFVYSGGFNGLVYFNRREKKSGDILTIRINSIAKFTFWREDIQQFVSEVAVISNCADIIEEFFISEDGRFWNQNNELKADNEESLFDYLAEIEYDFHPVICQRTYDILCHFGWYKGRCIDITQFNVSMNNFGIILTKHQLDFISEFSGLTMYFVPYDHDWSFYSLSEILEERRVYQVNRIFDGSISIGENLLEIGILEEGPLYLSSDGRLFSAHCKPLGRTPLEGINKLVRNVPEDYRYYE